MTDLATRHTHYQPLELLDVYAEDGVREVESRIDALATISAGRKAPGKNYPERSRDGTIYVAEHAGRAPNLEKILEASPKRLTIALPFDDLTRCIQQRFTRYASSTCDVYGDKRGLTEMLDGGERRFHEAGSPRFKELLKTCKVSTSVYFALARWVGEEGDAEFYWPDGLGLYRLRTTSRNSLRNIAAALDIPRALSGGRVMGVPLDLEITYQDTVDSKGKRQTIPVWALTCRPPFELTTKTFGAALRHAIEGAESLRLPPPREETLDDAAHDATFVDVEEAVYTDASEADVRKMKHGAHNATLTKPFFLLVKDTHLDVESERRRWLAELTGGATDSIKELFDESEDPVKTSDWLLGQAQAELNRKEREMERTRRRAQWLIDDAKVENYGEGVTQKHVDFLQGLVKRAEPLGLRYEDRLHFFAWTAERPTNRWMEGNASATPEDFSAVLAKTYTTENGKRRPLNDDELQNLVDEFNAWASSDDGAEVILGV